MSYRWVLAACCACGVFAGEALAQSARSTRPPSRSNVVRMSHEFVAAEDMGETMVVDEGSAGCQGGCQGGCHAACSCAW